MNFRTDEELVAFFKELFEDYFKISWGVKPAHIKILRNSEKVVNVEIISDFQTISATTEQLDKISKELKTKKISTSTFYEAGDCDTCDWGSQYKLGIYITL